jgi:hypothetical protein
MTIDNLKPGTYRAYQSEVIGIAYKEIRRCFSCRQEHWGSDTRCKKCMTPLDNAIHDDIALLTCEIIIDGGTEKVKTVWEQRVGEDQVKDITNSDGSPLTHLQLAVRAVTAMGHADPIKNGWDHVINSIPKDVSGKQIVFSVSIIETKLGKKFLRIGDPPQGSAKVSGERKTKALALLNAMGKPKVAASDDTIPF